MTRRELVKDAEVEVDEAARDLRRRAKELIASATFFFFSKRLRERRVGRSLCGDMHIINSRCSQGATHMGHHTEKQNTHELTCCMSGSDLSICISYAERLMPG